jgi:hypothetical protein
LPGEFSRVSRTLASPPPLVDRSAPGVLILPRPRNPGEGTPFELLENELVQAAQIEMIRMQSEATSETHQQTKNYNYYLVAHLF